MCIFPHVASAAADHVPMQPGDIIEVAGGPFRYPLCARLGGGRLEAEAVRRVTVEVP